MNQSRNWDLPTTLYQLSTGWLDGIASSGGIPVQWQKTCSNRTHSIQTQIWKTFMERKPDIADGISKIGRIPHWTAKKLGRGYKIDGNSKKSYEKTIWQEEMKPIRTKDRRQYVAESQEYPFKQTFKKAWPEKIQTL